MDDGIAGTAAFMAPEQVSRYWGPIDVRTDVYGLGAVFYTLLTGGPPFTGRTLADILAQVVSGPPAASPETIRPEIPDDVSEICRRCLTKQPNERYSSVGDLRNALTTLDGRPHREEPA